MLKNIKKFTTLLAFAALLGSALGPGTAAAQSKTSRDRDNGSASKGDRNRANGDDSGKVDRDRSGDTAKREDRNDRAPSKNKQRR